MSSIRQVLENLASYASTGSATFGVLPNDEAKLNETILEIKRIIEQAQPGTWTDQEGTEDPKWQGYVQGVADYHNNLLKALVEL